MIGACGGVGSTAALGVASLRRRRAASTGLASALPPFQDAGLCDIGDIVVGGHEIRSETLEDAVRSLHRSANVFDAELLAECRDDLRAFQRNIRPGTLSGAGRTVQRWVDRGGLIHGSTPRAVVERIAEDIRQFQKRARLRTVVVVDVASSEAPIRQRRALSSWKSLNKELGRRGSFALPSSSLYALAAVESGCPFINFTPSTGVRIPAIRERADALEIPYAGADGKTGETLVKSALAPLFGMRNLEVLSWFGQNILGNRDGEVLQEPRTRASKIKSKDRTVQNLVAGRPATRVGIDYVPSLHDWKVAWDFVHFRGFLGVKMHMQFVWQGCDSVLAAPLVLDLVRFAEREHRLGRGGVMRHLAVFFKDPIDVECLDLASQFGMLLDHFSAEKRNLRR